MDQFLKEFSEIQQHENPVLFSWHKSLDYLDFSQSSQWREFAQFFISSLKDLQFSPNAYHNQVHSAEAIFSAAILLKEEFEPNEIPIYAPYLLFAMMCHDIQHNGGHNTTPYELEKMAVNAMKKVLNQDCVKLYWQNHFMQNFGKICHFQRKVERIILGTEFNVGVGKNVVAYLANKNNNHFVKLNMLANEADIFVSIMNNIGQEKGQLLSVEQNQPQLASSQSRLYFLENLAHYVSKASQKLAIEQYLNHQINELKNSLSIYSVKKNM